LAGLASEAAPALAHELDTDPQAVFAALDRLVREHLSELSKTKLEGRRMKSVRIDSQSPLPLMLVIVCAPSHK
jgi:hypothetical protein